MTDAKAPERIWLRNDDSGHYCLPKWAFQYPKSVQYVRADLSDALTKDRDELQAEVERLREALIWCSGSDDFQESGKARAGWLKLCAPLLKALQRKEGNE